MEIFVNGFPNLWERFCHIWQIFTDFRYWGGGVKPDISLTLHFSSIDGIPEMSSFFSSICFARKNVFFISPIFFLSCL